MHSLRLFVMSVMLVAICFLFLFVRLKICMEERVVISGITE